MFESVRTSPASLPIEGREITATTLPYDRSVSETDYETATFGMG